MRAMTKQTAAPVGFLNGFGAKTNRIATALVIVSAVALGACAKKPVPNSAADIGLNGGAGGAGTVTPGSPQEFTVSVGDRVFFTTDSSSLTAEARGTLEKQAQWLQRYTNYPVTIEGHADERGTREYNLALGARRAAATRDFLVSRGVARSRIRTTSFGKERPVAVCNDISCWSQNRRAVTALVARGDS